MIGGISTMNTQYSMYRYGFSYGYAPARSASVQNQDRSAAAQAVPVKTASSSEDAGSQSAVISGSGSYLSSPTEVSQVGGSAYAAGFMQPGMSPEELAVRMRIQYIDPVSAEDSEKTSGLLKEETEVLDNNAVEKSGGSEECQTCEQRKYQDGSDDMGVSFQTPTRIAPEAVASAVRSHEQEHVTREQAKAEREGRRVISQDVTLHTAICPECGKAYISGGTTRTVTAAESDPSGEDIAVNNSGQEAANRRHFEAAA